MNVKTDTKEKFTIITPIEAEISGNMTEKLKSLMVDYLNKNIPHVILNLENVMRCDQQLPDQLVQIQGAFRERSCSFVVCGLTKTCKETFAQTGASDLLNITLTESEAWDIVQMEEIERELLSDSE